MKVNVKWTAQNLIADALERDGGAKTSFQRLGLKCVDCVAAEKETLADAARFHDVPIEKILNELNNPGNADGK